jgi:hypothetical protein
VLLRQGAKAFEEAFGPTLSLRFTQKRGGKSEREKRGKGASAHGCEIAQASCEATMTYRGRWVKVTAEVPVLEGEIGRDENLMPFRRTQNGAIVSDS